MSQNRDPFDYPSLARQIALQKRSAWDLSNDIPWQLGIDLDKSFLPLDDEALAFPGASAEQRLALSQWMGLVVNATIAEMEDALPKLRLSGWQRILEEYPVGPEMWELGDLFFEEEAKHSQAFSRYLTMFAETTGIDRATLDALLPKAYGSFFQRSITKNALSGGHAFWWIVEAVEEISIAIYAELFRSRRAIDPLYFELHRRHLEEEARHANYAFLMLKVVDLSETTLRRFLHKRVDLLVAEIVSGPWVVTELYKFFRVKELKDQHPFFATLASCIPLYESLSKKEAVQKMFFAAPYISWLLNPSWRKKQLALARDHRALHLRLKEPDAVQLSAEELVR